MDQLAREQRVRPYHIFMLALSLYAITALSVEVLVPLESETRRLLQAADTGVCLLFFFDFVYQFIRAPSKWRYFSRWGWIDLLSGIPMIDALRIGRLARVMLFLNSREALGGDAIDRYWRQKEATNRFVVTQILLSPPQLSAANCAGWLPVSRSQKKCWVNCFGSKSSSATSWKAKRLIWRPSKFAERLGGESGSAQLRPRQITRPPSRPQAACPHCWGSDRQPSQCGSITRTLTPATIGLGGSSTNAQLIGAMSCPAPPPYRGPPAARDTPYRPG